MESNENKKNLEVTVEFFGAVAGVVTGSGNLVTIRRGNIVKKILVDFGLFQGEYEPLNAERVLNPEEIDFVLLTHAHLDHCGAIPILYKVNGEYNPYTGKVYGSAETLSQAKYILKDAAKIYAIKQQVMEQQSISEDSVDEPCEEKTSEVLYLLEDAELATENFKAIPLEEEITICEGIDVKFIPNSHINGSTMIEIYASYGAERYGVAFTGDIGKRKTPLYREIVFDKEPNIDAVVLESLHGIQEPEETYVDSIRTLKKILKKCIREQKNLYIPVFALDRSAILLMVLNQFMDSGFKFNCFFDSPLAEKELLSYMRSYNSGTSKWFDYDKKNPFELEHISFADDYESHMRLVKRNGPNVVLTSSCMGYGGRVLDYFEHHIQDRDAVFVFPGFLPEGSPSKTLVVAESGKMVEINGNRYIKHCETYHLQGFSSHGYLEDKLEVIARYSNATQIFLTHGDEQSLNELEEYFNNKLTARIIVPDFCEPFVLN